MIDLLEIDTAIARSHLWRKSEILLYWLRPRLAQLVWHIVKSDYDDCLKGIRNKHQFVLLSAHFVFMKNFNTE